MSSWSSIDPLLAMTRPALFWRIQGTNVLDDRTVYRLVFGSAPLMRLLYVTDDTISVPQTSASQSVQLWRVAALKPACMTAITEAMTETINAVTRGYFSAG